ncbi:L,D-transpeptidase [Pseudonocardia sp. C8]|uniref:L,D-transpeptidase n=1 Tax=Pseudonocardia sp. C8 TaxID=2762759 RepID=UPI001642A36A|nr:L,D-transpeptidase [Pseudonocardia sp. C8]MBC3192113.1 L,D-transpeptidase [Pseudonocardia sp. C8]
MQRGTRWIGMLAGVLALAGVVTAGVAVADPADPQAENTAPPVASGPLVAGTPCTTSAHACVDLASRRTWLFAEGRVVAGPVPMRPGDAADPTPRGVFAVQWKAEQWTSRESYTQMPYSVFFAEGGVAFHQGAMDTPSAGCVKLGEADARHWFTTLQVGDQVQVH